jgi:four helix bundle protein
MSVRIRTHCDLQVYQKAFACAMEIYELSKVFPREEIYSLTDQIRKSSRSVCANMAEAWRKRRYEAAFVSNLSDSEGESAETQVWLEFAVKCQYLDANRAKDLHRRYEEILRMIVAMITQPQHWVIGGENR